VIMWKEPKNFKEDIKDSGWSIAMVDAIWALKENKTYGFCKNYHRERKLLEVNEYTNKTSLRWDHQVFKSETCYIQASSKIGNKLWWNICPSGKNGDHVYILDSDDN